MEKEYLEIGKEMLGFIEQSPCSFHAVSNVRQMLEAEGFRRLSETEVWKLEYGQAYYVIRGDGSLIGFRIPPEGKIKGFKMTAAHSDSPAFKIKENPEIPVEKQYVMLNTEKYGGMILSSWLDRPLSVAGRIAVKGSGGVETHLVNLDQDLLVIPSVAAHMSRDKDTVAQYNPQVDLLPLYGAGGEEGRGWLLSQIADSTKVSAADILGHDLFLYVRQPGRIVGRAGEFVLSPRLDDLQCVFACARAFTGGRSQTYIHVCAVFDHEEVGSRTRQGADSSFLDTVLFRICKGLGLDEEKRLRMLAESFLISADNAHAVHPAHPEKSDPTNRPYLNGGIVIKYHGGQKYTTDAGSGARMKQLCRQAGVPFQTYANRADMAGGSTLGNLSASHVPVESVDIGLPQLAMHSAVETAGLRDTGYAVKALAYFYRD